jgi:hypothetical protein
MFVYARQKTCMHGSYMHTKHLCACVYLHEPLHAHMHIYIYIYMHAHVGMYEYLPE